MRKNMKKFSVAALTAAMSLSMTLPAFAGVIQMPTGDKAAGHKYDVYQILTGDVSGKKLSNAVWGAHSGKTGAVSDEDMANFTKGDEEVLSYVKGLLGADANGVITNTSPANLVDDNGSAIGMNDLDPGAEVTLPDGYYLVMDDYAAITGKDEAASYYMLKVSGNEKVTIGAPKSDKPTLDKEVSDEAADGENGQEWGETADHEINEKFQFRLTAKIPNNAEIDRYKTYYLKFTDTMSKEVTYDGEMVVTVNGNALDASDYTVSGAAVGQAGQNFTVEIADLKKLVPGGDIKDAVVVVTFSAHLNKDAKVGDGELKDNNINKGKLTYSNNPNHEGQGNPPTGETPDDTVFVFTYDQETTKTDPNKKPLSGAVFQLQDNDGKVIKVSEKKDEQGNTVGYYPDENGSENITTKEDGKINLIGLDHAAYKLVEITAPAGFNKLDKPVEFNLSAAHSENEDGAAATATLTRSNGDDINIENKEGSELPETGGMGTTVIYTVGGMLVIGAGAALVSRRRRAAK